MVARPRRLIPFVLLTFALLSMSLAPALAQQPSAAASSAERAIEWLRTQQNPDGGFAAFGDASDPSATADAIYAFASFDIPASTVRQAGGASALAYLLAHVDSASGSGQAAKFVLAVRQHHIDPRNAAGTNLIAQIEGGFNTETNWYGQSFYGHLLAVLALAASDVEVPMPAIQAILDAQAPDGSWGFNGDPTPGTGDSNTTAMAMQALSMFRFNWEDARAAARDYLLSLQHADTGAIGYDSNSEAGDANSTALTIQALYTAGIDAKNYQDGRLIAALQAFQNPSGAFQFQPAFPDDSLLATAQAIPALVGDPFPFKRLPQDSDLELATQRTEAMRGCEFFDVTGHNVCTPFNAYWNAHGGLAIFGYPLTEGFFRDGLVVQYFERAIFEMHNAFSGTEWEVQLTLIGNEAAAERAPGHLTPATAAENCTFYAATQHNLCAGFRDYWNNYGGLATFGYPITEEFQENGFTVQYFERARFEWQPGSWPERFDVLLGRLAAEKLDRELAR